jgi:potassium efflux system protein
MQQIVNNFVSGILLLIERPLKVKDVVNVDGKFEGEVMQIGIRSLTVKTWNAEEVIIPNSAVITRPFVNWTRSDDVMRTLLEIQISYDSDPHEARQALLDILKGHPEVLVTPGPAVRLWNFTDSGMLLMAQYFSRVRGDVNRGELRSQINFLIYDRFAELGITIPYPQRDVHVKGAALPTP